MYRAIAVSLKISHKGAKLFLVSLQLCQIIKIKLYLLKRSRASIISYSSSRLSEVHHSPLPALRERAIMYLITPGSAVACLVSRLGQYINVIYQGAMLSSCKAISGTAL